MTGTVPDVAATAPRGAALFDLTGRTVLVTGAASGIGARVALGLAEAGADVSCVDLPASRAAAAETAGRVGAVVEPVC